MTLLPLAMRTPLFTTVLFVLLMPAVLTAQEGKLSAGVELGLPVGDLADVTSIGFGATIGYEHPLMDRVGLLGRTGLNLFLGKDFNTGFAQVEGGNWIMVPFQVGGKYYVQEEGNGLFVSALAGLHYVRNKVEVTTPSVLGVSFGTSAIVDSSVDVSFAPAVGYVVNEQLDLELRYQVIAESGSSISFLGLRVAYLLGL
jgi:hypothetical protein